MMCAKFACLLSHWHRNQTEPFCFGLVFFCFSARHQMSTTILYLTGQTKTMNVYTLLFRYFGSLFLCPNIYTTSFIVGIHFLFFFSPFRPKICVCLIFPSFPFRSASWYSSIPPLCTGVAVNQVYEMEMRTLSLSLLCTLPPSLSRHQNEAMPPMFFSDLGVLPNPISGAGRERGRKKKRKRGRKRENRMQRGRRTKRWKARGWKMNARKRRCERWGQSTGVIQEHSGCFSYYSRAQHNSCFSAEQLLVASGSGSADKMACWSLAKWKIGGERRDCHVL